MSRLKQIALGIAIVIVALGVTLAIPGDRAKLPVTASEGPDPTIPRPNGSLVPTVKVAEAKGWSEGEKPAAASGLPSMLSRRGSIIRAGSTVCRTAMCWSPRPMRRSGRKTEKAPRARS